ncbi:MAG: 50S ribosomal protein L6 [bacterium]|jgi:large subunit ribosomal protein L6|nr:50S ribosomal protein L6 [bacterium]
MSRIGKKPVPVPKGVEIKVDGQTVTVKGKKGDISFSHHPEMEIVLEEGAISVKRPSEKKSHKALHGLTRALIANMVHGVTEGFEKRLEIVGVGYKARMAEGKLELNMGFSHPVLMEVPKGLEVEVPKPIKIVIRGISKHDVGEFAAKIRDVRPPEPYKGKGIRYEGEYIVRKAGKRGAA